MVHASEAVIPPEPRAPCKERPQRARTAIGIFLFFDAIMACLAGATLIWRETRLDLMWTLNMSAFRELSLLKKELAFLF
jgi:hypothetical protein